jgi:hypothetical protein
LLLFLFVLCTVFQAAQTLAFGGAATAWWLPLAYKNIDASTRPQPPTKQPPLGGPLCHVTAVVTKMAAAVANVFTMLSAYLFTKKKDREQGEKKQERIERTCTTTRASV